MVFIVYATDISLEVSQVEILFIPPSHTAFAAVTILAGERDSSQRKLKEAVEIRHQKPEVNLHDRWSLI